MRIKDGRAHLAALDVDREVFLDGQLIKRVTEHPAFRESCKTTAALYDFQARDENIDLMTYDTGAASAPTALGRSREAMKSWLRNARR